MRMRARVQVGAWVATRAVLAVGALSPWYGTGTGPIRPWSDVELYADYATRIADGALPYAEVAIEYPAGVLPLLLGPQALSVLPGVDHLAGFVACALLLDLAGLIALRRLAGRTGQAGPELGVWAWIIGVALLGPLVLLRLDLLPVVAVLWAAERAAAGRWVWTGGLLVVGAAAKLWPAGLLPAAAVAAPRWRRVALGVLAVGGALLVAVSPVIVAMLDASVLRNLGRGLQVESLWGSLLLAADVLGLAAADVHFADGADVVSGPVADLLVWPARAVPVAVLVLGAWLARRRTGRPPAAQYAHAAEATTLVLVAGASVLSAQFVLWAVGAVAAVACWSDRTAVRRRLVVVGTAGLLTTVEFPWLYASVTAVETSGVALVVVRNLLLVVAAVAATRDAHRSPTAA